MNALRIWTMDDYWKSDLKGKLFGEIKHLYEIEFGHL